MEQVLTCQRCHHGSRNNASREEETRERLSSLIRQNGLTGGRDCCYWMLLAESSRDRFVILEGIHETCWIIDAGNDEFQLVAVGNQASEDGCKVFWPGAKDLACVVQKIMRRKKRNAANESEEIIQESAIRGLLIYHLVGSEARFTRAEDEFSVCIQGSPVASLPSLEFEMQMLSRVLKPPSVFAATAASPSLLARCHHDNTASSSSNPLALDSVGMDNNNHSEAASYELLPELPMIMATAGNGSSTLGRSPLHNLMQELAAALPHFIPRSSGARGRYGGGGGGGIPPALIEFLIRRSWTWSDYDLEAQRRLEILLVDYYLEAAGQQAHRVAHLVPTAAAAAPVQEPSEVGKMIEGVMGQAYGACLPACVTAYPLLKDAPDYVKFTIFGGLASITVGLFVGLLSRTVARRQLAFRLVSFLAIALLTFSAASLFSSPTSIALIAFVGVALNFLIMLLRF